MGAGIAKSISQAFPEARMADACSRYGSRKKLGTFTHVDYGDLIILNLYTQFGFGGGKANINYNAVRKCMKEIKKRYSGKRIGLPIIGASLAGGDWNTISNIIDEELNNEDVTIVKFKK